MADKLIYDPNDPNYKFKPSSMVPSGQQQTEKLPTFTESELEAKFATENKPGNLQGETVAENVAARQALGGTSTPTSGQPTGETPVADKPAGETAGTVTTPNVDPNASANIQDGQIAKMNEVLDPTTGKPKEGTTPEMKQDEVVTTPSNHLFKWGEDGVTLASVMAGEGKNVPKRQILDDYFKWSQENGKPIDYFAVVDIMNGSTDLNLSPEDDEKAKKKAERKEKWDKFGNFLLHLGNAIGNVAGGGYGSLKLEDPVQWTERQRLLKEKADQQRRTNNQSIIAMIQKGWADQRAAELAKQQAVRQQRRDELDQRRLDNESKKLDAYIKATEQKTADNTRRIDSQIENDAKRADAAVIRANRTGRSGGRKTGTTKQDSQTDITYERDRDGKVVKSHKKTTYGNSQQTPKKKGKGDPFATR